MTSQRKPDVEIGKIKRKADSWEGITLQYLLNHRSRKNASDLAMEAITIYWLAEALENQSSPEEIDKACWWILERLSGRLLRIMKIAGIDKLPAFPLGVLDNGMTPLTSSVTPQNTNTLVANIEEVKIEKENEDESDEDDLITIIASSEMMEAQNLFDFS